MPFFEGSGGRLNLLSSYHIIYRPPPPPPLLLGSPAAPRAGTTCPASART